MELLGVALQELIPYEISPAQIWETSLVTHIRLVINRFVQTGRVIKKYQLEDLQNLKKWLSM